ncbi:MAG: amidohydrolase [Akkermansiaceae bacterium]
MIIDTHVELPQGEDSLDVLDDALEFSGISSVIIVQREPSNSSNQACLNLAKKSDGLICGVVAWAPITNKQLLKAQLSTDNQENMVCGYVVDIHREEAREWSSNEDAHYGARLIHKTVKPLELILQPAQVRGVLPFLDAHPDMPIVLDHCLGEAAESNNAWRQLLREIGRRPHVFYRMSGLAPVANADTACKATESVKEVFDAALDGFGTQRLIYGSGWPVTPARYPVWLNTVDNLIHTLSPDEQADIFGGNAAGIYGV